MGACGAGRKTTEETSQVRRPYPAWEGVAPRQGAPPHAGWCSTSACRRAAARRASVWRPRGAGAGGAAISPGLVPPRRAAPGGGSMRWSQERVALVRRSWRYAAGGWRVAGGRGTRGGVQPPPASTRGGRVRPGGGLPRRAHVVLGRSWGEDGGRCHQGAGPCQFQRPTRACT